MYAQVLTPKEAETFKYVEKDTNYMKETPLNLL
jgi:hypothetical protein